MLVARAQILTATGASARSPLLQPQRHLVIRDESGRSEGRSNCLLGLFKINPEMPEEISRWQVPRLHFACWAGPVLSRGKLYLRSEDQLVCLNVGR